MLSFDSTIDGLLSSGRHAPGDPRLSYTFDYTTPGVNDNPHEQLPIFSREDWPSVDDIPSRPNHGSSIPQQRQTFHNSESVQISLQQFRELQQTALQVIETLGKMAMAREEALRLRDQSTYERLEYLRRHKCVFESQGNLTTMLRNVGYERPSDNWIETWMHQREELEHDFDALRRHTDATHDSDTRLLQTDFYLNCKEVALTETAKHFLQVLGGSHLLPGRTSEEHPWTADEPALSLHASTPEVPFVLEIFYEKAGEVGWKTDRLYDLQHDHEVACTSRAFRQDRGEQLDISDEEFQANYRQKLSDAQNALNLAVEESRRAKEACFEKGINPDTYKKTIPASMDACDLVEIDEAIEQHQRQQERQPAVTQQQGPPDIQNLFPSSRTNNSGLSQMDTDNFPAPSSWKRDKTATHADSVLEWIANTDLTTMNSWNVDPLQERPESRALMFYRRSVYDLQEEPAIKEPAIREYVTKHFQPTPELETGVSQPKLYGRHPRSWNPQLSRYPSDPGIRRSHPRIGDGP